MIRPRTPLLVLTRTVFSDLVRTLRSLWLLVLIAGVISLVLHLVERMALGFVPAPATARELISLILGLVLTAMLAPMMVAVHRFILRNEVTRRYADPSNRARTAVITTWLLAYTWLITAPSFLLASIPSATPDRAFIDALLGLAILIVCLRLIILVPALAVDAPGATWRNSLADTRGHFWYILGAVLIPSVPFFLIELAVLSPARGGPPALDAFGVLASRILTTIELPFGVIILSRLYEILGDRVDQPLQSDA